MKEIIEDVKTTIQSKQILWSYPIISKLYKYRYSLSIQWVLECLQIYSAEIESKKLSELSEYIDLLIASENILTFSDCNKIGQEIWYLPARDEIQTSIARLWWSIASFKSQEEKLGIMECMSAVELLLPDVSNQLLLERYLEAALNIYKIYKSQLRI